MRHSLSIHARRLALGASVVLLPVLASAQQVYRIVGPDGKVTYSDAPPPVASAGKSQTLADIAARAPSAGARPVLRKGQWELSRSFTYQGSEQPVVVTKCTDPLAKMEFWQATLGKVGCRYEPTSQSGSRYTQMSSCTVGSLTRQYRKTLNVQGDAAYTLEENASGGGQPEMSSVTKGRRLGDC
ncbi:Protein of unknown function (DUF3617) [Burkholderiales bacterium JOSHI_001]|nr:Protein of unknown function (DUF3617) [Burkholderiales bacterium JOSHI_001]